MLDPRLAHAVAVARYNSFTGAAQAVGITQSAITKSVADLERQIGYLIFHRTSRGVMLTEEGRDFTERAARLVDDARELLRSGGQKVDEFSGTFRIGVAPASLDWILVDPLEKLLSKHPLLRLDVSASSFERVVQQLASGAIDIALGYEAAFSGRRDVKQYELPSLKTVAFVRLDHPLTHQAEASISDLSRFDFVMPSDSRPYSETIRNIYESQGMDSREHMHIVNSFPIVKRIVASTSAISLSTLSYVGSTSFKKRFAHVPSLFDNPPKPPLACAVRAHYEPKPAVRPLVAAIRESLQALKDRFPA